MQQDLIHYYHYISLLNVLTTLLFLACYNKPMKWTIYDEVLVSVLILLKLFIYLLLLMFFGFIPILLHLDQGSL